MTKDEVQDSLTAIRYALDELPETASVLHVQVCDTLGNRIQIESGSGWFQDSEETYVLEHFTANGAELIDRSRVVCGVRVHEAERM